MEKGNLAGLADVGVADVATGVVAQTSTTTTVLGEAGSQVAETLKSKVLDKTTDALIEEAHDRMRRSGSDREPPREPS